MWNLDTGECESVMEGHTGLIDAVAFTPDGKRCVSGSRDNTLRMWDLATGQCVRVVDGNTVDAVFAVVVTPDGKRCVSAAGHTLSVWNLEVLG